MTVRIYRKQKLIEVSFVTIPSNDNGMVVRSREQNLDIEVIRKWTLGLEGELSKRAEPQVLVRKSVFDKYETYFERKQPANREATKVLEKFYKRLLKEDAPADEAEAWKRMGDELEKVAVGQKKKRSKRPQSKKQRPLVSLTRT